jgi:DNA-directed RNA polymerase specialized sigma24 family protein
MPSVSEKIAPHLPYLRRFARALTGTQTVGDIYVQAALEALIAEPSHLADARDVRTILYRLLLGVWRAIPINAKVDASIASPVEISARRNLEAITPRPRIAFLLRSLEGFSIEQIAHTLDCSTADAQSLIDAAGREIAEQIKTDVLIIEDEPFIALDLQTLVEDLGHRVIDIARTHTEAVSAIETFKPGLILADIQLADGSSGLEAVNEILNTMEVPVVFITAYPERFLTGDRPEPAFLITKPFLIETVKAVISQALFFDRRSHRSHRIEMQA